MPLLVFIRRVCLFAGILPTDALYTAPAGPVFCVPACVCPKKENLLSPTSVCGLRLSERNLIVIMYACVFCSVRHMAWYFGYCGFAGRPQPLSRLHEREKCAIINNKEQHILPRAPFAQRSCCAQRTHFLLSVYTQSAGCSVLQRRRERRNRMYQKGEYIIETYLDLPTAKTQQIRGFKSS